MASLPRFTRRFRSSDFRSTPERDVTDELSFHLAQKIEDLIASGLSAEEAERRARASFGDHQRVEEECTGYARTRARRRIVQTIFRDLSRDVRLALRGLRRVPGFTLAAVLILALGLGANITTFSALKLAVLTPPPFPEADRLVNVDLTRAAEGGPRTSRWAYPYLRTLINWPDRLVDPVAGYRQRVATLTGFGPATQLSIEIVSPDYFRVVGRPLVMGRGFHTEEADPSLPHHTAVVSHTFWRRQLGGDPAALGREITLNGESYQVVGVAPANFSGFSGEATLWLPLGAYAEFQPGVLDQGYNHVTWVVGRLRPGATLAAARSQMEVFGQAIAEEWPRDDFYGADVRSFTEAWVNPEARTAALLLTLASALVLLVACANLAGLLYARARNRMQEGAVRRALGASRWHLIRLHLTESLIIALFGGLAGLGISLAGVRLLAAAWPARFLQGADSGLQVIDTSGLTLDAGAIGFAVLLALVSALLFGLLPALRLSSSRLTDHLKEGARATRRRRTHLGLNPLTILVSGQVALALLLLVGVGLMGSTVSRLLGVDEGFDTERLLSFDLSDPQSIPRLDPRDVDAWRAHITLSARFDDRLKQRLEARPEIEGITFASASVLNGFNAVLGVYIADDPSVSEHQYSIGVVPVADNYFDLLDIPLVSGRGFLPSDGLGSPSVAVLNQAAADLLFPDQDPIGRRIGRGFVLPDRRTAEVVGVVGDVMYTSPTQDRRPVAYYSLREARFGTFAVVRTAGDPRRQVRLIQEEIFALDPTVAMSDIATLDELLNRSVGDRGLIFWLLLIFSSVTVLLAAIGTWGVVAYAVADRRRELGLRIALGAQSGRVLTRILHQSFVTALAGLGLGLLGAWAGSRLLETFLWETSARDPRIFLGGGALLLAVVLLASYLPARRVLRIDPVEALRAE